MSRIIRGHEWRMLQAYQFFVDEDAEKQKNEKRRQLELEAKRNLDLQVLEKQRRAQLEKEHEKEYVTNLMRSLNAAEAAKEAAARMAKEKHDRAVKLYEEDLAAEKKRKQNEKDEVVRQEQAMYEAILRQAADEREHERIRKLAEHERQMKLIEENEKDKLVKEKLRIAQIAEDQRLNKEFAAKLDREQREREGAFAARMEKLKKFAEIVDNGPQMKAKRDEEARLDAKKQRELQETYDAQLKREIAEAANRRNDRIAMQTHNFKQIEERNRAAELNKLSDKQLAERYLRESQEHQRIVKEKRRLELEARKIYGSKLLNSMNAKSDSKKTKDDMIERERRYNSQNLRAIVDDTKVFDQVCGRLKLSLAQK